jgi:hypothetical protein
MKTFATTCVFLGTLLGPTAIIAQDADTDRSQPAAFVDASAITMTIKSKLVS